jgi:putative transposase
MVRFIDEHRATYGVEPICAVLPIAPSVYYEHKLWQREPSRRPARAQRDEDLGGHIRRVWNDNFEIYGVRKVWRHLVKLEKRDVARCTVARLMRDLGLQGAVRGKCHRPCKVPQSWSLKVPHPSRPEEGRHGGERTT